VPSTVEQLSPSRVKLTVEIPFADLKPHIDRAYRDIAAQITIPGFRKGKVPAAIIDQRFGRGTVLQEAINAALPAAYSDAVNEAKVTPLLDPEIEVTKLEDGDAVEFTAIVDVRPEFELPALSTVRATVDPLPSVDAELAERLELLRARFATTNEVDRPAQTGDHVTINLVATRDGEPIEDGKAEGVGYVIGEGGMLDGLDDAVTGMSAGESVTFMSTLVGGASEGEAADVEVTLVKVSERELPALDDEFAQMVSEFDTIEEMRANLASDVERYAKLDQQTQGRDRVLEALVDATEFEVPQRLVEAEIDSRRQDITDQLGRAGLTLEAYLENAGEDARTPEEFWAQLEKNTVQALKAQLILDKVAAEENVPVEQADLSAMLVRRAMQNGTSPEQEAQHMVEHGHAAMWMQEIRRNKALAVIVGQANVVDTNGKAVDLTPETPSGADAAPSDEGE